MSAVHVALEYGFSKGMEYLERIGVHDNLDIMTIESTLNEPAMRAFSIAYEALDLFNQVNYQVSQSLNITPISATLLPVLPV